MTVAWDVFDVWNKEKIFQAKKQRKVFRYFYCSWRNVEEMAPRANQLYLEKIFQTDCDCYNLRNRNVKKNLVLHLIHFAISVSLLL